MGRRELHSRALRTACAFAETRGVVVVRVCGDDSCLATLGVKRPQGQCPALSTSLEHSAASGRVPLHNGRRVLQWLFSAADQVHAAQTKRKWVPPEIHLDYSVTATKIELYALRPFYRISLGQTSLPPPSSLGCLRSAVVREGSEFRRDVPRRSAAATCGNHR